MLSMYRRDVKGFSFFVEIRGLSATVQTTKYPQFMNFSRPVFLFAACCGIAAAQSIDLASEWRFALDPQDLGIKQAADAWKFPDKIRLPGILTAQGLGETPAFKTAWTGDGWRYPELFKEWQSDENFKFPFFLQPPKHYVGPAWYQRDIEIPENWDAYESVLHLERVHWQSTVWVDGKEAGKCDWDKHPAAHQLLLSLMDYMATDKFAPSVELTPADLDELARTPSQLGRLGCRAAASSAEPGHEAALASDNDPATLWHTEYTARKPEPPHELRLSLGKLSAIRGGEPVAAVLLTQRQDHNANGQVDEAEIVGDGKILARANVPKDVVNYRIPLPAGTRINNLIVRVNKSHAGPFACLAEVDIESSEP